MKAVIQRVNFVELRISGVLHSEISKGLLVLLGICNEDTEEDINWLINKIINMRIFSDSEGKMNNSVLDTNGELLVVSQFTLYASTKKGNRPSFIHAAKPDIAIPLYERFLELCNAQLKTELKSGVFGADMKIKFENDGPVTIILDSKNKI